MFKILIPAAIIAVTVTAAAWTIQPNQTATPVVPVEAKAFGTPVGGPNFAQVPPAGYPATFTVNYNGPDGSFATTCYYKGYFGERHEWASVPVATTQLQGAVVVSLHTGIRITPNGAWLVEVGNVNSGLSGAATAFSKFGQGYIRVS